MKKIIRAVSLVLAALMALSALAGCGGTTGKQPAKQTVNHVYKYTKTDLISVEQPDYSDEKKFTGATYIQNNVIGADGYAYALVENDKDYKTVGNTVYFGDFSGGEPTQISMPVSEDGLDIYISNMVMLDDGIAILLQQSKLIDEKEYIYEQSYLMNIYDKTGTLTSSFDIRAALGQTDKEYFYADRVLSNGTDIFVTTDTDNQSGLLYRLGADGTVKNQYALMPEGSDGYLSNLFFVGEESMVVIYENYGQNYSMSAKQLDLATGETKDVAFAADNYQYAYNSFGGKGGSMYCAEETGINKIDPVTGTTTELLNFINSDYIYNYGNFFAVSDDEFVMLENKYDENKTTLSVARFTKVPESELVPKYLITVASAGYAYNFQEQIVKFNLSSDEYRIKYTDYSQYNTSEDYTAGATKLSNDILAGNIPDVLIADTDFSVSKYINKGLFADLYTFMENDPDVKKTDFLENILAGCETNGKLYELPTNFYVFGFIGAKDKIAEYANLTMSEFAEKVKALPEGVSFLREGEVARDQFLRMMFFINYGSFIDGATGKCSLNNDDFKAILSYVKDLPEKSMWENDNFDYSTFDWDAYNNVFKEGKAIAEMATLSSFSAFRDYSYEFGATELDFVGAPAPDRDGMVFTTANLKFLVSAKGAYPTEAWNFVKIFFEDEYQSSQDWGFPVTKAALETKKQEMLEDIKKREENPTDNNNGGIVYGTMAVAADETPVADKIMIADDGNRQMTAADVELIYNYVLSSKKQLVYDESVYNIVAEEASAYFSGQKSLDEVAALIESRVNIYINESR